MWEKFGRVNFSSEERSSSSHHGEAKHLVHMISTSRSGWVGVLNGVVEAKHLVHMISTSRSGWVGVPNGVVIPF